MLLKVFCVLLLTSLRNISGTNSEQNRQVVYEKCRGPGKDSFDLLIMALTTDVVVIKVTWALARAASSINGASM